jgi:hypothetical protein
VFTRGLDDRVYRNRYNGYGTSWTGWWEVPGGARTRSAMGAISYAGALRMYLRGTDKIVYRNRLTV